MGAIPEPVGTGPEVERNQDRDEQQDEQFGRVAEQHDQQNRNDYCGENGRETKAPHRQGGHFSGFSFRGRSSISAWTVSSCRAFGASAPPFPSWRAGDPAPPGSMPIFCFS